MNDSAPVGFALHVGVDIAARKASIAWLAPDTSNEQAFDIPQTPAGMLDLEKRLLAQATPASSIHIIMEATGGYHHRLATFLV